MTTGLTPQGFVAKTVDQLTTDISTAELANIDPLLDTSPEEPIGQVNGIVAEKLAELWELAGVAVNGMSRDNAENFQLDNVNGLTGTKRQPAKPSFVLQTCVFSQVGTYATGSLVANVSGQPSVQFANGEDVIVALVSGTYTVTVNNVIVASNGSLPITAPGIKFICTVDGPTVANASTLTVITAPVTGWQSTTNPLDATLGALVESDTAYRLRGDQEISASGSGNPDAMRADVLNVPGVIQAFVLENNTDTTDGFGTPPHAFRVVVWDGSPPAALDNAIAQAIWNDKPTGIPAVGAVQDGTIVDSTGQTRIVPFNRANQDLLYVRTTVTMMTGVTFNAATALAIKQALVLATQSPSIKLITGTFAANPAYLGLGDEVVAEALKSAILTAGLGVLDVTLLQLGFAPSPTGTINLAVDQLSIALADTSRILVNGI